MIIKRITLKNFFRFYGEVKIDCSYNTENNVTVIKGDNGTGKTTILSAFHWAFYGDVVDPLTTDAMLNKRQRNEMPNNSTSESFVLVEISDKGVDYQFLRKQLFYKDNSGNVSKKDDPQVIISDHSTQPHSIITDREFFKNIIPKNLRGFFFFDGERIDRLAKIDGKNEIRQATLDLLGLTNIKNIQGYLSPIKNDFNRELSKLSSNIETKHLTKELDSVVEKINKNNETLEKFQTEIAKTKEVKERCDSYLKSHNVEIVRQQEKKRDQLNKENDNINNIIENDKSKILKHISKHFKTFLIADSFSNIADFLDDKRKKKQLPSDIKETFLNDLLDSKICICGRPIHEGTPEFNSLLKLKETAGSKELDDCYSRLVSFIKYSDNKELKESFFNVIYQHKQKVYAASERKEEIKKDLNDIKKYLQSINDVQINENENLRDKSEERIIHLKAEEISCKNTIKRLNEQEQDLNAKISKAEDKNKGADIFRKSFSMVSELEKLNNKINEFFIDVTQQDMDIKLKEVFSILARKQDREPILSKNFELQIVNKETQASQLLSQGERQITSLSFIGAIVSYAKEKANMGFHSSFAGGDYPIVMDSPFGNLDPTHKENVAKGIPLLATQVIVIISEGQWNGVVAENMRSKVGEIYEMKDGYTSTPDSEFTEIGRAS
ncbi:MAG: hypothetical protein PHC34_07130 [Candidatus Gastranaerophilales bacterium]|nr:hypothetical protein [Candidatus Gastranaerophilales bacterium]